MNTEFRRLEARDICRLMPYFGRRSNLTCDSVIFDSFLWQDYFDLQYMIWEDRAVFLRLKEEGEIFTVLPICDAETLPEAFEALQRIFAERGEPFRVCWADEEGLRILQPKLSRFQILEQVDLADYIYDAEKLRTLAGKKYHKKKNHLNAFLKEYEGRWEYRRLHRWSRCEIWSFLERWEQGKDDDVEEHLEAEMTGLHHYLFNMDVFDAVMAGIYIDGKLEAFTVGSYNAADRMAVIHVEKANGEMRGLYTLINQQFLVHEFPDALLVNREDDVGIPALRKAKESYHPIRKARKFELRPRSAPNDQALMADARDLWETIFSEDSAAFLDYYDREKARDNRIQTRYEEGCLAAMAQWNPYVLCVRRREVPTRYLVGVATREEYRHRGYMTGLLRRGLQDLAREGVPLVFLMPADPAIYTPLDFRYIYEKSELLWDGEAREETELSVRPLAPEEYRETAVWLQENLNARFDVFCRRDAESLRVAQEECASEGGGLMGIFRGGCIGVFSWWQEDVTVVRDLVLDAEWEKGERLEEVLGAIAAALPVRGGLRLVTTGCAGEKKPIIMGRIVSLAAFLRLFRTEDSFSLTIDIRDEIIPENNEVFCWRIGPTGSVLEPGEGEAERSLGIAAFLQMLLTGTSEEPLTEQEQAILGQIALKRGTYFPEIV